MNAPKHGFDGERIISERVRDLEGEGKRDITRKRRRDTVGWLAEHHKILPYQEAACRELQRLAERAELANYTVSGGSRGSNTYVVSDAKLQALEDHGRARAAIRAALDHLGSSGERLITLVVLEGHTLGKAAGIMRQAGDTGRGLAFAFHIALDGLARHFRYGP